MTFQQFDAFLSDFGWGMFGFLIITGTLALWVMFGDSIPLTVSGMVGGVVTSLGTLRGLARRSDRNWVARAIRSKQRDSI